MATTTTVNGFTIPQLSDTPNIETSINTFANAIDARVNPIFSTTTARNTAIPSPVEGQECYVTGTKEKYVYNGTAWVSAKPRVFAPGSSGETVTDSTTLTNSTAWQAPLEINSTYVVNGVMIVTSTSTTNDFKFDWTTPAGIIGRVGYNLHASGITATPDFVYKAATNWTNTPNSCATLSGGPLTVEFHGVLGVAGTAGSLVFRFSEETSIGGVTSVTLAYGSYLMLWKVA